jgi:hypothetical protein
MGQATDVWLIGAGADQAYVMSIEEEVVSARVAMNRRARQP